VCIFSGKVSPVFGLAPPHPISTVFAKKPKIQRVCVFGYGSCENNGKSNRSANYGTTNKSASAGFFVSPKTKKCRTGYTRAAENSELRPFAIDIHTQNDTIRA
jgi:hypothetical protein